MEMSIWIAKLFGPVLVVAAIPLMAMPGRFQDVARGFLASPALIYVSGIVSLLGGLAIVNTHNVWVADWPVIVTLLGWLLVVGGIIRVAAPSTVTDMGSAMLGRPMAMRVAGVVVAALGLFLAYKAYF